jgi:NTP pyrophosphatase (non-canonical NTP hydrolase)
VKKEKIMIDSDEFKIDVHQLVIEKGWYDTERSLQELPLLIQSELFEAFECWRNNDVAMRYDVDGKPCGLPSEMADVVIRTLDMAGYIGKYASGSFVESIETDFVKWVFALNKFIANGFGKNDLVVVVNEVEYMCRILDIDLESAIIEKHKYNKTRPYRHGNKKV